MPQSRHRKINKAKKRPRSTVASQSPSSRPQSARERNFRVIAMALVAVFALAAVIYVLTHRGSQAGAEVTTPSGLKYVDLVEGTGVTPQRGQTVTVHYVGTLENGTQFDSSRDRGQPADFRIGVGAVIKGWDEGLMSMKVGGRRKLIIPPALGYGPIGRPPDIPGNSTLVFDVELLGVK